MDRGGSAEDEPEVEGVIVRPGKDVVFELRLLPKQLPLWVGGPGGASLTATLLESLLILTAGERHGVKIVVFRGSTVWRRSVTSLRAVVVLELCADAASAEIRARDLRRAVESGAYDETPGLTRDERRRMVSTAHPDRP